MHASLLAWFDEHKRDLPWRRTSDPYAIWVSEIMLQQTQVATVIPYYERWLETFPSAEALAAADEQEVLSQWQGLGYYRRCRNLLKGAQYVTENGRPSSARDWEKVPGVGRYTAGAIASIAHQERTPLVDGNVERVFARLTGCRESGANLNKAAWLWAGQVVPDERPGDFNQALMELGATACTPKAPSCGACPLSNACFAFKSGEQTLLPVPKAAPKTVSLQRSAYIPFHEGSFGLEQIAEGQWWHGMWQFPGEPIDGWSEDLGRIKHQVTHHKITLSAYLVRQESRVESLRWVDLAQIQSVPMPAPQRKVLKLALAHLGA
jgi:A/G-specific adenine glycosylase